jgi:pyrroloquinoline quinone biosynthesis protein B
MRVKILGSAAGGGFPQWNCACANCHSLRARTFQGKARGQTQVAVSREGEAWFLLGASPDLRSQIDATAELHPRLTNGEGIRQSPIVAIVLANADLDHVLGLLLLRELHAFRVHATKSVRRILTKDNSMFGTLERVSDQVSWNEFTPGTSFPLLDACGDASGLRCRALPLGTHYPSYVSPPRRSQLAQSEASQALIIESPSNKRLAYMPAVPRLDAPLLKEIDSADVLLFDGTFWSDDELIRIEGSTQTAREMGHVPVSGEAGSLRRLAQLRCPRKIYIHINNTNPILNEAGPEYRQVRESGWEIAEDGWQFDL